MRISVSLLLLFFALQAHAGEPDIPHALEVARSGGVTSVAVTSPQADPTASRDEIAVRPKITGEFFVDADLKTLSGRTLTLSSVLKDKYSVVVFSKPEKIWFESAAGYFRKLVPYLNELEYQVIVITPEADDTIKGISEAVDQHGRTLIDSGRTSFIGMGLMDRTDRGAPSINAIYLVSPSRQILFQYASVSENIPFSGEVLVLAAKVYRDADRARVAK